MRSLIKKIIFKILNMKIKRLRKNYQKKIKMNQQFNNFKKTKIFNKISK